jgi:hypothetical protein
LTRTSTGIGTTEQGELFPVYRHHAVFTGSTFDLPTAETQHRDHAIIEQVLADLPFHVEDHQRILMGYVPLVIS